MNRELARKRPADVVNHLPGPALPRHETLVRPTKREALAELKTLARRHEIGSAYLLKQAADGQWALAYSRIKEPSARRVNWLKVVGLLMFGAGAAWLLVLAVKALTVALAALVPILIVIGAVVVVAALAGGSSTIEVLQKVTIKR